MLNLFPYYILLIRIYENFYIQTHTTNAAIYVKGNQSVKIQRQYCFNSPIIYTILLLHIHILFFALKILIVFIIKLKVIMHLVNKLYMYYFCLSIIYFFEYGSTIYHF